MMRSTMYRNLLRHLKKPAILLVWLFPVAVRQFAAGTGNIAGIPRKNGRNLADTHVDTGFLV